ncbi:hypothetical protein [Rhodococcus chondri]|uniref:Uncharacterized protein n=1 Tax=Rhodococcus chondri TaxID=3065941 RepID=A0ABU7JVC7_9NOCA|nr:hypothetical protein [Rhodococcus sp. CC-R104]MEE2033978.1 hypothetical protein [Rhodococcus sp. CC-R104]
MKNTAAQPAEVGAQQLSFSTGTAPLLRSGPVIMPDYCYVGRHRTTSEHGKRLVLHRPQDKSQLYPEMNEQSDGGGQACTSSIFAFYDCKHEQKATNKERDLRGVDD